MCASKAFQINGSEDTIRTDFNLPHDVMHFSTGFKYFTLFAPTAFASAPFRSTRRGADGDDQFRRLILSSPRPDTRLFGLTALFVFLGAVWIFERHAARRGERRVQGRGAVWLAEPRGCNFVAHIAERAQSSGSAGGRAMPFS